MQIAKKTTKKPVTLSTLSSKPLAHGVGRRKSAVARVWLRQGNGTIAVNGKEYTKYFDTDLAKIAVARPFDVLPTFAQRYNISATVNGGGLCGQADAVKLAISRAILSIHEEARSVLREFDLLTVDDRLKERKKYGQKAARRKFQFVKR